LKIIHVTCHINIVPRVKSVKVTHIKSLSEYQFGPHILLFLLHFSPFCNTPFN